MAVVKIIELVGSSTSSSDDAVQQALAEARKTLRNIKAVDVVSTGLRGHGPRRVARAGAGRLPRRERRLRQGGTASKAVPGSADLGDGVAMPGIRRGARRGFALGQP
jgi:hypothetical protein